MFFQVSVPTRISTDPGHGTKSCVEDYYPFSLLLLPTPSPGQQKPSRCVFLLLPNSPRGPPWNEGHRPKVRHETSVLEVPAQEQHEHSFYSSSTNTFITGSLYMARGYRTSPGAPDLGARLGWLQGSTRNGM